MPTYSLDDLREDLDSKYGPLVIEGLPSGPVKLTQALRLSKDKRGKLMAAQKRLDELQEAAEDEYDEDAILAVLQESIRAAASEGNVDELFGQFGDDLAAYTLLFQKYSESSQLGEASSSPS